jgi:hypothetical protein
MAYFPLVICALYIFFPILGYLQFKKENLSFPESQRIRLSFKELRKATFDQTALQMIKWSVYAAIAAFISLIPLLGLPGGALLSVFGFFNLIPEQKMTGDKMWPIAILVSILIPLAWPVALLVRNSLIHYWNIHNRYIVMIVILAWFIIILFYSRYLILE